MIANKSATFAPSIHRCISVWAHQVLELKYTQQHVLMVWTVHARRCSRPKWDIVAQSVKFHHTLTWNSTMHYLSKIIFRHGVPLSTHKLPIYLMCPHTLFFTSILRLPISQLFLCHIHCQCMHDSTYSG